MVHADIWTFYEELAEGDREALTPLHRGLAAICDLRQEVNSGGFASYFTYWGGDTAPEALDLLRMALGEEWADLLREAMGRLGAPYPRDENQRGQVVDDLDEGVFDDVDQRFFSLEAHGEADTRLSSMLNDKP